MGPADGDSVVIYMVMMLVMTSGQCCVVNIAVVAWTDWVGQRRTGSDRRCRAIDKEANKRQEHDQADQDRLELRPVGLARCFGYFLECKDHELDDC